MGEIDKKIKKCENYDMFIAYTSNQIKSNENNVYFRQHGLYHETREKLKN